MSTCWDCKHLDKRTGGFQYCLLLGRRNVDANKDRCDEFDLETMTTPPLSPAAQAVLDAVNAVFEQAGTTRQGIAAALIAAADQMKQMRCHGGRAWTAEQAAAYDALSNAADHFLSLATELETHQ